MRSGSPVRFTFVVALAVLALAGGLSCSSDDEPESSTKTTDPTSEPSDPTGSTGSTAPSGGSETTIVDTGCNLAPATTAPGELSGGHIVCPGAGEGKLPIPPDTEVPSPDEGGGVITGTLTDEDTGEELIGVIVVPELRISVATGADGRFGLAAEAGTYHLSAIVNRDVSYTCSTPTVEVTEGDAAAVEMTCHH